MSKGFLEDDQSNVSQPVGLMLKWLLFIGFNYLVEVSIPSLVHNRMSTGTFKKLLVGRNNNDIMDFFCRVPLMYMCDIRGQVTFFVHETSSRTEYRSLERQRAGKRKKKCLETFDCSELREPRDKNANVMVYQEE